MVEPVVVSPRFLDRPGRLLRSLLALLLAGLSAIAAFIGAGLALVGLCCGAPLAVAGAGTAAGAAGAGVGGPGSWPFFLAAAVLFAAAWLLYRGRSGRTCRTPTRR